MTKPVLLMQTVTCLKCGHQWTPRIASPEKCPHCANPNWWEPRKRAKKGTV